MSLLEIDIVSLMRTILIAASWLTSMHCPSTAPKGAPDCGGFRPPPFDTRFLWPTWVHTPTALQQIQPFHFSTTAHAHDQQTDTQTDHATRATTVRNPHPMLCKGAHAAFNFCHLWLISTTAACLPENKLLQWWQHCCCHLVNTIEFTNHKQTRVAVFHIISWESHDYDNDTAHIVSGTGSMVERSSISVPSIDRCISMWQVCCWAPCGGKYRSTVVGSQQNGIQQHMRAVSNLQPL